MTAEELLKIRNDYRETYHRLNELEKQLEAGKRELRATIEQVNREASIMFIHPDGTRWVTTVDRNRYSERHIWEHDGKRKGAKIISDTRMGNASIRLTLAEKDL